MSWAERLENWLAIDDDELPERPARCVVAVGCTLDPSGLALSPQSWAIAVKAADLYFRGHAEELVALGSGYKPGQMPFTEGELMLFLWRTRDIPNKAIVVADTSYNTRLSALELKETLQDLGIVRGDLIVVAQQLHARRVKLSFQKVLGPAYRIYMVKTQSKYGGSSKWFMGTFWRFLLWDTLSLALFKVRGWI